MKYDAVPASYGRSDGTSKAMTWKPAGETTWPHMTWSASAGSPTAWASAYVAMASSPPKTER